MGIGKEIGNNQELMLISSLICYEHDDEIEDTYMEDKLA